MGFISYSVPVPIQFLEQGHCRFGIGRRSFAGILANCSNTFLALFEEMNSRNSCSVILPVQLHLGCKDVFARPALVSVLGKPRARASPVILDQLDLVDHII